MSKLKKDIQPLYPLAHDYKSSLDNAHEKSMLLFHTTRTIVQLYADKIPAEALARLQKALDEYQQAFYGDN